MINAIYVLGHGRHGKDTVCEMLEKDGFTFCSSSMFIARTLIYPVIKEQFGYKSYKECFERRHEEGLRKIWYDMISEYNIPDGTRLSTEIFEEYDIYAGMRNIKELNAVKHSPNFKTFVVWVDASDRLGPEPSDSFTITKEDADYVVDNNGNLTHLRKEVDKLMNYLPT